MDRRIFLGGLVTSIMTSKLFAALEQSKLDAAADILKKSVASHLVSAATIYVSQGEQSYSQSFGESSSPNDMYLLASISKPISIAALMTLYDQGQFQLSDPVVKFIPEFVGDSRERITIQHLLTHVCGLPDQLPNNSELRRRHAPIAEFVSEAIRTPLLFEPGTRYRYSSMGILLAAEIAQRISKVRFAELVDSTVFQPLGMMRSALGLGSFSVAGTMRCQVQDAAPESGGGDATAASWDWNSEYWRNFGAPWGGAHGSAKDVAAFLAEFLRPSGKMLKPETAAHMLRNHNPSHLAARGLGFAVGASAGSPGCSERTFGHTGSTGTLAWADPVSETICVVLTTLPSSAADPHPRRLVSDLVAGSMG